MVLLNGHDSWRFMVAASALFHATSSLSALQNSVFSSPPIIPRSATSIACYGSPFDGMGTFKFASLAHDVDWVFGSICDALSLGFQCLRSRCIHTSVVGRHISIPASLVQDEYWPPTGTITIPSLRHGMVYVDIITGIGDDDDPYPGADDGDQLRNR